MQTSYTRSIKTSVLLAAFTYVALSMDLTADTHNFSDPAALFGTMDFLDCLLFPLLFFYYRHLPENRALIKSWTVILPSLFFAWCMLFGLSFELQNDWFLVLDPDILHIIEMLSVFLAYFLVFSCGISALFHRAERSAPFVERHPAAPHHIYIYI